jgi:hypothetical protein
MDTPRFQTDGWCMLQPNKNKLKRSRVSGSTSAASRSTARDININTRMTLICLRHMHVNIHNHYQTSKNLRQVNSRRTCLRMKQTKAWTSPAKAPTKISMVKQLIQSLQYVTCQVLCFATFLIVTKLESRVGNDHKWCNSTVMFVMQVFAYVLTSYYRCVFYLCELGKNYVFIS